MKKTYYLATLSNEKSDLFLHDNIDEFKNVKIDKLKEIGLNYYTDFVPNLYDSIYVDDINYSNVLKYKKLSHLLIDYLNPVNSEIFYDEDIDDDEYNTEELVYDEFDIQERLEDLLYVDYVVSYNTKTKLYSVLSIDEIINCFNSIGNNYTGDVQSDELPNFFSKNEGFDDYVSGSVEELINRIEETIEFDGCVITTYTDVLDEPFMQYILKKDTNLYNHCIEKEYIRQDTKESGNGFVYEIGYDKFYNIIKYYLLTGNNISFIINNELNEFIEDENIRSKNFSKIHGFLIGYDDGNIKIIKLSAKELHSIIINTDTNMDKLIICGINNEDIICGFDLK